MANTVRKNFRFQQTTCDLLAAAVKLSGQPSNDSRIAEMSISLYCMEIAAETAKARQFLFDLLQQRVALNRIHRPPVHFKPKPKARA